MAHTPHHIEEPDPRDEEREEDGAEAREGTDEGDQTPAFQRCADEVRDRYRRALDRLAE